MTVRRKLAASVAALVLLSAAGTITSVRTRQRTAEALATLQTTHARMRALLAIERELELRWQDIVAIREARPDAPPLEVVTRRLDALQEAARNTGLPPSADTPLPTLSVTLEPILDSWRSALASTGGAFSSQEPLPPDSAVDVLNRWQRAEESNATVDGSRFRTAIDEANASSMALVVVSLFAGVGIVAVMSVTLTRGFARLAAASRHVAAGDYDFRLPVQGDDEFARTSRTFNDMAAALAASTAEIDAARARAEEASATKSTFLTSLSHDLKTPLTAILGHADLIESALPEASPALDDIRQLRRSAASLLAMVGEVSDFARLEGGRMPVALDAIEPARLVADVAATLRPLLDQRGNTFALDDEYGGLLTTDSAKLRHILLNLLGNACKFTRNGHIAVRVRPEGTGVAIEVRDSGIGMSEEEVDRVFAPYMQANSAIGSRFGGSGLGLAISKQFAELLGGGIVVVSALGAGSTFTVTLPDLSGRALLETAAIPTLV